MKKKDSISQMLEYLKDDNFYSESENDLSSRIGANKEFDIPKIDSIPGEFFHNNIYEETLNFLGFKISGFTYEKTYTNGKESISINIGYNGFQWIAFFPSVRTDNGRAFLFPNEFAIQEDLTTIEILAILYLEWAKIFRQVATPKDLYFGHLYSEHIKNLKQSRPPKPLIYVERNYFRFIINKIKKEHNNLDSNENLVMLYNDGQLILCVGSKKYHIPVIQNDNFTTEKINISLSDFIIMIPLRFKRDQVYLTMRKDGLLVDNHLIRATWDGPNLWEHDEYDEFLSNRLIHRKMMFGG